MIVDVEPSAVCIAAEDEIVLLMGLPASGKTRAVAAFVAAGYVRLNRDLAGGRLDDLLTPLRAHLTAGARRFVLDNTYTLRRMRAGVLAVAAEAGLPARCVWIAASREDARYNAALRLYRKLGHLPDGAELAALGRSDPNTFAPHVIDHFAATLEPPELSEGIARIERVRFVREDPPGHRGRALLLFVDGALCRSKRGAAVPTDPDDVALLSGRRERLAPHVAAGARLFGIVHDPRLADGGPEAELARATLARAVALLDLPIDLAICPHAGGRASCWCRPPLPGLGVALLEGERLARHEALVVGAGPLPRAFARGLGVRHRDALAFFGA